MEKKPLISIIVPVYNAQKWLDELLATLRGQTYTSWEAVLVDDGSVDDSADICRKWAALDDRFRWVRKTNGGLSSARNFGLQHVGGEWILFVDADDMLMPEALERLFATAQETEAEIVVGSFHRASVPQKSVRRKSPVRFDASRAVEASLYQQPPMTSVCGVLYHRNIFFPDGPRFCEGIWYEDLEIHYKLLERAAHVAYLPEKLYFYRKTPGSILDTVSSKRFDVLNVTDAILARFEGTSLVSAARDRRFSAHFNILLLLLRTGYDAPQEVARCWAVVKQGRGEALRNRRVRLKNKIGAILSYVGMPMMKILAKV